MISIEAGPTHLTENGVRDLIERQSVLEARHAALTLQVVHVCFFTGENEKKGIKGKVLLSDGISRLTCILSTKAYESIEKQGLEVRNFDIWVINAGRQQV